MARLISKHETGILAQYVLSGVLLGVSLIYPSLWVYAFGGVLLFIVAITRNQPMWALVAGGLLTFVSKMLFATSYILTVYPVEGIGIELGSYEVPVILYYWVTSAAAIGIVGGAFAPVAHYVYSNRPRAFSLLLPVMWVASEVLGSFSYSLFMSGDGSHLNISNTGGYIGYALAEHQGLLAAAQYGGAYFLSLVVVMLATVVWSVRSKLSVLAMGTLGLAVAIGLCLSKEVRWEDSVPSSQGFIVRVIDTEFGGSAFYNEYSEAVQREIKERSLTEAVTFALETSPEYIILSEDSLLHTSPVSAETAYEQFRLRTNDPRTVIISAGPVRAATGGSVVRASVYDGMDRRGYSVDKQHLVPLGEYMPLLYEWSLRVLGMTAEVEQMKRAFSYEAGPKNGQASLPPHIPAIMFCFESLDARGALSLTREREVPFVAHPISHAWFHESHVLWHQLDAALKVQAVWSQVPIVSAANMAKGALYTPQGEKMYPRPVGKGERWFVGEFSL